MASRTKRFPAPTVDLAARFLLTKYTARQLAARVGVSPRTIDGYVQSGLLHEPLRTPGGHRRFDETHVEAILAGQEEARKAAEAARQAADEAAKRPRTRRAVSDQEFFGRLKWRRMLAQMDSEAKERAARGEPPPRSWDDAAKAFRVWLKQEKERERAEKVAKSQALATWLAPPDAPTALRKSRPKKR